MIPTARELELEALLQNEQQRRADAEGRASFWLERAKLYRERAKAWQDQTLNMARRIDAVVEHWWLPDWVVNVLRGVRQ